MGLYIPALRWLERIKTILMGGNWEIHGQVAHAQINDGALKRIRPFVCCFVPE